MGRTGPVVRAGLVALARRGGVTAVTATAAVLLTGCGTRLADLPARGGPAAGAAAASSGPPSTGPPTPPRAGPGRGVPAGSRAGAQALAHRLLARLLLPPDGRPVRMRGLPPSLRQPQGSYGGAHAASVSRLFWVSEPVTAVQGFLMAHQPAGMKRSGYGQGTGPGSGGGTTVQPGQTTMASVTYQPRSLPDGIYSAELDATVVPGPGGGALVKADAEVIWYPARSAAEQVDPERYRAAVLSIGTFSPKPRTAARTITSARVIAQLAALVNGLRAAPYQPPHCPAILASYRITFVPADTSVPRIVVTPSGCMTVGVTVAGVPQPPLWGGTGLIGAAARALRVGPVR